MSTMKPGPGGEFEMSLQVCQNFWCKIVLATLVLLLIFD